MPKPDTVAYTGSQFIMYKSFSINAKPADARELKSRVPSGTYRFDSDPGHQYGSANP